MLLAIDPGNEESAFVILTDDGDPLSYGKVNNEELIEALDGGDVLFDTRGREGWQAFDCVAIEFPQPRGQLSSRQLFDTIFWIGRFFATLNKRPLEVYFVDRKDVKMTLCENPRAKDANIRQALIDRYGGHDVAIGGKKCDRCKGKGWSGRERAACARCDGSGWEKPPGPLKSMASDMWQALGVGVTHQEMRSIQLRKGKNRE